MAEGGEAIVAVTLRSHGTGKVLAGPDGQDGDKHDKQGSEADWIPGGGPGGELESTNTTKGEGRSGKAGGCGMGG